MRIVLYFHSVISEDVETQKHGVVIIFAAREEVGEHLVGECRDDIKKIVKNPPFRIAVCHQSCPDGPKFQLLNAVWFLVLASKVDRVRTKFHRELSHQETQYELLSYGIPVHQIPRTNTGNIKVKNHLQWINTRIAIDQIRATSPDVTSFDCSIIGHPGRHDVLFSKGGNASYPGNMELLEDINELLSVFKSHTDRKSRKKVFDEIVASVEARNGRLLQLQDGGWWEKLPPDKVHEKLTTLMRAHHRKVRFKKSEQSTNSDTSVFLPKNKRQKVLVGDDKTYCGCRFL